ncbi:MAG: class II glutamine amidotransferase, partial [Endomicrobium sp.]|nr:class II glutamine amidotransferase [Endomicrobium sp.]
MCGIIGYVGNKNSVDIILNGLSKLEYRGYDSSGICAIINDELYIKKKIGKICNLKSDISKNLLISNIGIGHTRWATHGKPSEKNAHPHVDFAKCIAIVHNGIVENYVELQDKFFKQYQFNSETDSEIIAHLIKRNYENNLLSAVQKTLIEINGFYA